MGIDFPNVWQGIHWGHAYDTESIVRTTGRAGQDGLLCFSQLFFLGLTNSTSKSMINYCFNDVLCWRREFFKDSDYFVQLKGPSIGGQCSGTHTILQVRTV